MTNRENTFRLADSQEAVRDNNIFYTQGVSYTTLSAARPVEQNITFHTEGEPILQLRQNGDIYVQGRLAANDMEVVNAMRQFLGGQGLL